MKNFLNIIIYELFLGSHDQTIRLWDLAAGKSMCTLTHHKKSVRAVVLHPKLYMFASASPDNIKQWKCPEGKFIQNLSGHNAIINCMAANSDGVLGKFIETKSFFSSIQTNLKKYLDDTN